MKNQGYVNFLVDNDMMLDQISPHTTFAVGYLDTDNSVQHDCWSIQTLWDEIEKDDVTILSLQLD